MLAYPSLIQLAASSGSRGTLWAFPAGSGAEPQLQSSSHEVFQYVWTTNVNVNWYFLMEPSRKCHAFELNLFLWRNARGRHWKCGYTHSSRLQPSSICMPQLQSWCSAALVPKFTTLKSGMKAQVSFETTIEPHDLVYYLGHELALHGRKTKVLPLDQRCLQMWLISHQNIWCDMSHFCVTFSDWKLEKKTRKYYNMKFRNIKFIFKKHASFHGSLYEFCIRFVIQISLQKGGVSEYAVIAVYKET